MTVSDYQKIMTAYLESELRNTLGAHEPVVWIADDSAAARFFSRGGQLRPGVAIPGIYGETWGMIRTPARVRWTCPYCGGLRASDALRCDGCGASR